MALPTPQYRDEIVMLIAAAVGESLTTQEIFDRLQEWEVPLAETLWSLERLADERRIIKVRVDGRSRWTYPRVLPPHQDVPRLS